MPDINEDRILNIEKARSEIRAKYHLLFREGIGREVLKDILNMCHFGVTLDPDNKVQVAEYNVGLVIAEKAGVLDGINKHIFGLAAKE
jgi:hypothetical protein